MMLSARRLSDQPDERRCCRGHDSQNPIAVVAFAIAAPTVRLSTTCVLVEERYDKRARERDQCNNRHDDRSPRKNNFRTHGNSTDTSEPYVACLPLREVCLQI
jgi:tRNA U54 and U55 pseudouridine synthase Pus10